MSIAYSKGFKYQLREKHAVFHVGDIGQTYNIDTEWISLTPNGVLTIEKGYAWDGSSGPTIDSRNTMRASLIHDALYELIRKEHLPPESKIKADELYHEYLIADGVSRIRAGWHYWAVDKFGWKSTLPSRKKEVLYAP